MENKNIVTEKVKCMLMGVKDPYAYDFNGKKGVSYSASLLIKDSVIVAKMSEEVYNDVKDLHHKDGNAVFGLSFYDGKLASKPELVSFDWE